MSSVAPAASPAAPPSLPTVIDVEAMTTPVAGDNPSGESLQYSGVYDEIREARRSEDVLEQGDWQRDTKVADWHTVVELATDALTTRTKDLQIGAWLTEALTELHGFTGLRDALAVLRGMQENLWETLYPEEDEGDLEGRANCLAWMDRQVAISLKRVPITRVPGGVDYSYLDWEMSNLATASAALESSTSTPEAGKMTSDDWAKAKQATPRSFYEATFLTLNECWTNFAALDTLMDEKFGRQTPGLSALKKSLDGVRTLVEKLVKEKRLLEPDALDGSTISGGEMQLGGEGGVLAVNTGAVLVAATGPVRTRQEAISRLAEVATYFRQTEPHSPVSYLVERAIKWSQMPLETWLASVIKDDTVLDGLRETLGVKPETPDDS